MTSQVMQPHNEHKFAQVLARWQQMNGLTNAQLARRIRAGEAEVHRWVSGLRDISVKRLPAFEDEMGVARGYFMHQAGLAETKVSVVNAIKADGDLTSDDMRVLIAMYDYMVAYNKAQ